ncbi:type I restriction-modification enzyme R subunit C-terminal domain-containing protein [Thiocapsa rosea]|uniref:type I restriction-modification enzyme R subunit C-terminal domain-containing protein n=1 Tax=Thiocapsa rosea TaxID=69360 RepID=UPI001B8617F3
MSLRVSGLLTLDALLDKYADRGITEIEDPKVSELPPFSRLGSKTQIRRRVLGGPDKFTEALTDLEHQLYRDTAKTRSARFEP